MNRFKKIAAFAAIFLIFLSLPARAENILMLVNSENPLPESYRPEELVPIGHTRGDGRPVQMMCPEAAEALDALLSALASEFPPGNNRSAVSVTSGYRSHKYQKFLFDRSVSDYISQGLSAAEARKRTARFIAVPGTSEHETGLAADLHNLPSASQKFSGTDEFLWLCENAHRYGFILRYPRDKENVTGIGFEPWHWRYVGKKAALQMRSLGLCLEEYLKYIEK